MTAFNPYGNVFNEPALALPTTAVVPVPAVYGLGSLSTVPTNSIQPAGFWDFLKPPSAPGLIGGTGIGLNINTGILVYGLYNLFIKRRRGMMPILATAFGAYQTGLLATIFPSEDTGFLATKTLLAGVLPAGLGTAAVAGIGPAIIFAIAHRIFRSNTRRSYRRPRYSTYRRRSYRSRRRY